MFFGEVSEFLGGDLAIRQNVVDLLPQLRVCFILLDQFFRCSHYNVSFCFVIFRIHAQRVCEEYAYDASGEIRRQKDDRGRCAAPGMLREVKSMQELKKAMIMNA